MQKTTEDCFYFLTSTCSKGPGCLYRHNPVAVNCSTICSAWLRGNCLNSNCNLRHSNVQVQRPTINNGITCFYENTPKGCLKSDCTYMHTHSRFNIRNSSISRPSTTNLVNKPVSTPEISEEPTPPPVQVKSKEPTPPPVQIKPKEPTPPPQPIKSVETVVSITNQSKSPNLDVINSTSDETKTPSRVVVNRNVVVAEPNRTVVQNTSNRVVVSSQKTKNIKNDSDSDFEDFIEQESDKNKTKTVMDITFPCSAPRLFVPSKPTTPTNDTKPIRLNRNRLPAVINSTSNNTTTPSKEEQISAGTGLLTKNEEERRINRLERFKIKPNSPPRSIVNTTTPTTRNVINSSPNDRKRPAPDPISQDSQPSKRLSSQQENNNNHHHQNSTTIGDLCSPHSSPPHRSNSRRRRRRSSSFSSSASASSSRSSRSPSPPPVIKRTTSRSTFTSTMNESAWNRQVDEFLAKTSQPKTICSTVPVPLLSLRPQYTPPVGYQQSVISRPHPRQTIPRPNNNNKRPSAPIVKPAKPIERPVTPPSQPPPPPAPAPIQTPTISKDDDELTLLKTDEPTDVVDTFALIDEVLLETDFLELM